WGGTTSFHDAIAFLGFIGMLALLAASSPGYRHLLLARQGEQALLRLTALAGDASLLNRRLALQCLRHGLPTPALLLALAVLTFAALRLGGTHILSELALCCLAFQAG